MAWTAPQTWADGNTIPEGQLNTYIRDNQLFLKENILLEEADELTINAGAVTATKSYHAIDTEADAAEDDLDTIAGVAEGRILYIRAEHTDRTVILKNGTGNLVLGTDIYLDNDIKHVALICDADGDLHLLFTARDVTFMANAFQYPVPATEWEPSGFGAHLPVAQTAALAYLPLNFLKIGDVIISYNLTGDMIVAGTSTLDCKLVRVNLADPITTTDITNGAIAQQTADGDFDVTASVDDETVATDKMYYLLITGTTDAADEIYVMGAEVLVRRLV